MTASTTPPRLAPLLRWALLGAALLVVGIAGAFYLVRLRNAPPIPPEGNHEGLESAVVESIAAARQRVLDAPRSAKAWGVLGQVFLANEIEEESRTCFAQAERFDPGNPRWPYYQAGTILNQGDFEGALPFLQRAVDRCDPDNTAPRLRLGETLTTLGRLDEAEGHFQHVLAQHPEDVRAHFDLGLIAVARQDWPTARTHLLRCLGSPFARQKARLQLALVCRRLGDLPGANEFSQQAQRLPKDGDWVDPFVTEYLTFAVKKRARYRLAENLEAAGRFREAAAVLQPMTVEHPNDYQPYWALGKVLGQMGNLGQAEAALRKARQLAPDKVQVHYYLGLILLLQGENLSRQKDGDRARAQALLEESANLARQALRIKPDYGPAYMSLGRALKYLGKKAESLAALRQAVHCTPEFGELHFYLGEALAEAGQGAEAKARLEHALREAPPGANWVPIARNRLAQLNKKR